MPQISRQDAPEKIELPDEDRIGYETLQRMASVTHYNRWIYQELAPFVGDRILEVGCGIGNMTAYFLGRELLVSVDRLQASVEVTRSLYAGHKHFHVFQGDITDPNLVARLQTYPFDTVLGINVLEHIHEDTLALMHMWELLRPGGRLLLVVPAGRYLYGSLDRALGHHRRYDPKMMQDLAATVGFAWQRLHYMNLAGIPGWWLNSRLLKRELLPESQLRWFNRLAPFFIRTEGILRQVWDVPAGQSLVGISQKKT